MAAAIVATPAEGGGIVDGLAHIVAFQISVGVRLMICGRLRWVPVRTIRCRPSKEKIIDTTVM